MFLFFLSYTFKATLQAYKNKREMFAARLSYTLVYEPAVMAEAGEVRQRVLIEDNAFR